MKYYNPSEFFNDLAANGYEVQITEPDNHGIMKIEMKKDDHYIMNCYVMHLKGVTLYKSQRICAWVDGMKDAIDLMLNRELNDRVAP